MCEGIKQTLLACMLVCMPQGVDECIYSTEMLQIEETIIPLLFVQSIVRIHKEILGII